MAGKYLPSLPDITRQAIVLIAATVIAALVIKQFPQLRDLVDPDKGI